MRYPGVFVKSSLGRWPLEPSSLPPPWEDGPLGRLPFPLLDPTKGPHGEPNNYIGKTKWTPSHRWALGVTCSFYIFSLTVSTWSPAIRVSQFFISLHVGNHWGILETGSAWDLVKTYGFQCFLKVFHCCCMFLYNGFL